MKKTVLAIALFVAASPAMAQRVSCEDLKKQIEDKLTAQGVKGFTLTIVANEAVKEGNKTAEGETVVGSCDGGTRKIVYKKAAGG